MCAMQAKTKIASQSLYPIACSGFLSPFELNAWLRQVRLSLKSLSRLRRRLDGRSCAIVGASTPTVERERNKITRLGWGARLLARQDSEGMWARGGSPESGLYSPKWTSTTYTMLTLRDFGLPSPNPRAKKACPPGPRPASPRHRLALDISWLRALAFGPARLQPDWQAIA
jgi:hypothetical protein